MYLMRMSFKEGEKMIDSTKKIMTNNNLIILKVTSVLTYTRARSKGRKTLGHGIDFTWIIAVGKVSYHFDTIFDT